MKTRILVDLETMGVTPGSAIISIGAVKFSDRGWDSNTFYERISLKSNMAHGLTLDADTLMWWMKQSDEARAEVTNLENRNLASVLQEFKVWMLTRLRENPVNPKDVELWGNGASFDNAILGAAYDVCGIDAPWERDRGNRCYRTVKALHPDMPLEKRTGTHHNALDDAISQAEHLIKLPSFKAMCETEVLLDKKAKLAKMYSEGKAFGVATGRFSATEQNQANTPKP